MFTSISHIGSGLKDVCVVFNFTFFPFGEKKKGLKHEFNPVFKEAAVNPGF